MHEDGLASIVKLNVHPTITDKTVWNRADVKMAVLAITCLENVTVPLVLLVHCKYNEQTLVLQYLKGRNINICLSNLFLDYNFIRKHSLSDFDIYVTLLKGMLCKYPDDIFIVHFPHKYSSR